MNAKPLPVRIGPQLATDERRRSERRPYIIEAWLRSSGEEEADRFEVGALNISHHGIGFEIEQAITPGSFWFMEIGLGQQRIRSEIRIVSCRDGGTRRFAIGAVFC